MSREEKAEIGGDDQKRTTGACGTTKRTRSYRTVCRLRSSVEAKPPVGSLVRIFLFYEGTLPLRDGIFPSREGVSLHAGANRFERRETWVRREEISLPRRQFSLSNRQESLRRKESPASEKQFAVG